MDAKTIRSQEPKSEIGVTVRCPDICSLSTEQTEKQMVLYTKLSDRSQMVSNRVQKDLEEMSDFLVIKSTEEQRAEGVEDPVDTAYIDDRDGLPILKAVFDIHHFQPDDVTITVGNTSSESNDGGAQRQLVLFAQLTDDSRECSLFKKVCITSECR